ncbi:MAG: hypothetical protein ACREJC_22915 [Tepidisphaeraceae bacterium]
MSAGAFGMAQPVRAAVVDTTWLGGTGSWSDAAKWSTGVVPNNSGGTTYRVVIPSGTVNGGVFTIDSLTLNSGAGLLVTTPHPNAFNVLGASQIDGSMTLSIGRTIVGAPGSLTGTGVITIVAGSGGGLASTDVLDIGGGLTVSCGSYAYLTSSVSGLPIVNRGYIVGGGDPSFGPFIIGNPVTNLGTIEARNGAVCFGAAGLSVSSTYSRADLGNLVWGSGGRFGISGTLLNEGQTLTVDTAHPWLISAGTVQGGLINIAPGATLPIGGDFAANIPFGGTLDGVVVNGRVELIGRDLNIKDGLLAGAVDVSGDPFLGGRLVSPTPTLAIDADATIHGRVGVGNGANVVVNHGTIRADLYPDAFVIRATAVENDGVLAVTSARSLRVQASDDAATSLTFDFGGTLDVQISTVSGKGLLDVRGALDLTTPGDSLVLSAGALIQQGVYYRIVTTTEGVIGQFDSVTPNFFVDYRGNEIWARYLPEPPALGVVVAGLLALRTRRNRTPPAS